MSSPEPPSRELSPAASRLSSLEEVLAPGPPEVHADAAAWWVAHRALGAAADDAAPPDAASPLALTPFDAAVRGGARADRIAWAFASGYEAALWRMLPARDRGRAAALCATELTGVHPRAMKTRFVDGAIDGHKAYVTLGPQADDLLVLATEGEQDGRPRLALVRVEARAAGVHLEPLPDTPFVPEIPHAAVRFDGARGERLAGDGWAGYVRPFRTVEDIHVHASTLAYLAATGVRQGWPEAPIEAAVASLCALAALSPADPDARETHVALAGVIAQTRAVVEALEPSWDAGPPEAAARWRRDRRLLEVASKARSLRRAKAWARGAD